MTDTKNMMAEAIPRLAVAMTSVLKKARVECRDLSHIEIVFDDLPDHIISIRRRELDSRFQIFETSMDLRFCCLGPASLKTRRILARNENRGLRGVTVVPTGSGLRLRAGFVGQKGRTSDEIENLSTDVLTIATFSRILRDRLQACSVDGAFSLELYREKYSITVPYDPVDLQDLDEKSRIGPSIRNATSSDRYVSYGHSHFCGSTERVFGQVLESLSRDFQFQIKRHQDPLANQGALNASVEPPRTSHSPGLKIEAKIPREIPVFACHTGLMNLSHLAEDAVDALLGELNSQLSIGHFDWSPSSGTLSFSAWKHLTNDLRSFSFDYIVFLSAHAHSLAKNALENFGLEMAGPEQNGASDDEIGTVLPFKRAA